MAGGGCNLWWKDSLLFDIDKHSPIPGQESHWDGTEGTGWVLAHISGGDFFGDGSTIGGSEEKSLHLPQLPPAPPPPEFPSLQAFPLHPLS